MSTNGRRAWRKWARAQRGAFGMGFKDAGFARRHPFSDEAKPIGMKNARPAPVFAKPFASLLLVGMTMSARKRAARLTTLSGQPRRGSRSSERYGLAKFSEGYPLWLEAGRNEYARQRARYRIGERLRPCHGCSRCGVLRFQKVGGFVGDCCDYLLWTGSRTLMVMKAGMHKKRVRATLPSSYPLPKMQAYVADGSWQLLRRDDEDCDGSGVLPARPRSARC